MSQLRDMESGECRWVHRHDIHVYCRHPWPRRPEDRRYAVACPDAGLAAEVWMDEDETTLTIDRILAGALPAGGSRTSRPRPAKRGEGR